MQTEAPGVPVDSPATTTPQDSQYAIPDLAQLTPAERHQWELTGDVPKRESADTAAPSTQPSVTGGSEKKAAPDSQPVKPQEPPKKNAESRIRELNAENQRLRDQLAQRPAQEPAKPQPSQAAQPKTEAKTPVIDDDPEPTDRVDPKTGKPWANWNEYQAAVRAWDRRQATREIQQHLTQREQQQQSRQQFEQTAKTFLERRDAFLKEEGLAAEDFDQQTSAALGNGQINQATALFLLDSDLAPALIWHLTNNPELVTELKGLGAPAVNRRLARLEIELTKPAATETKAPPVVHTRAPKPARDLGARSEAPADEELAAAARGDFAAYERIANANALAKNRRH